MGGIWDGMKTEVIVTDPDWVGLANPPGKDKGLAVDTRSRAYAVYYRATDDSAYFRYKDPGREWSAGIALPVPPVLDPHVGVTVTPNDDVAHFVCVAAGPPGTSYLMNAIYDFASGAWTVDTACATTRTSWPSWERLCLESDALGGRHLAWAESAWNDELHAYVDRLVYADNTSGLWRKQVVSNIGTAPILRVDPAGRAYLSYLVRRDNHNFNVFLSNGFRGNTYWSGDSVDTAPANYVACDMRILGDSLHVLFHGQDCYGCFFVHRLFYTRRGLEAAVWDPWIQLFDHANLGKLLLDCAGRAHVFFPWYDDENKAPWMYYSTNSSGSWVTRRFSFGDAPDNDVGSSALLLDRFDQAHAVFTQVMPDESYRLMYYGSQIVYLDVIDVVRVIDHVYGGEAVCDPYTYDEDCNGSVDAADVVWIINYCFRGGPNGCRF
jgi:hypothetical protein